MPGDTRAALHPGHTIQAATLGERAPVSGLHNDYSQRTTTPEWVIKMADLLSSYVTNFEDHTEVYYWGYKLSRPTNPSSGGPLYSAAAVSITDIQVVIPNTDSSTTLEFKMMKGEPIESISIKRLANINGVNVTTMDMNFDNCFIQTVEPHGDQLKITFKCTYYKKTAYRYDQNGESKGQTEVSFDFETTELK